MNEIQCCNCTHFGVVYTNCLLCCVGSKFEHVNYFEPNDKTRLKGCLAANGRLSERIIQCETELTAANNELTRKNNDLHSNLDHQLKLADERLETIREVKRILSDKFYDYPAVPALKLIAEREPELEVKV